MKREQRAIVLPLFIGLYLMQGAFAPLFSQERIQENKDSVRSVVSQKTDSTLTSDPFISNPSTLNPSPVNPSSNEIKIKLADNMLTLENLKSDGVLEIYNIMGAKVYSRRIRAGTSTHVLSLPKGYYILKIGKFTRKISLK